MCTSPNFGVRVLDNETGAKTVKFIGSWSKYLKNRKEDICRIGQDLGDIVLLPCGNCMECKLSKAREWSIRLLHEAQLHKEKCFLTLTYNDEHLPENGSLCLRDLQLFMKNYRKKLADKFGKRIRFYACGEYGSKSGRPHYHLLIFGDDFSWDRRETGVKHGYKYFRSDTLESLWDNGFSVIGDVSYDSVFYVARYCTKKIKGSFAEFYYDGLKPEFAVMSRRPGIGHDWLLKYSGDVYNYDEVLVKNMRLRPPAYYDRLFSCVHPFEFCDIKDKRVEKSQESLNDLIKRCSDKDGFSHELYDSYLNAKKLNASYKVNKKKGYERL